MQDGIIAADGESRILYWNDGATRIFGRPRDEALGRPLTELMPARFRAAHREGIRRVREGGEAHVLDGPPVQLMALRADGSEFPIELTLGCWREGERTVFTGVVRDVSERDRANRLLTTQYAVAVALAESQDLGDAVVAGLRAIGRGMGWSAGEVWTVDEPAGRLRFHDAWAEEEAADGLSAFRSASEHLAFRPGEGLPGRVWQDGEAAWIADLERDENFPRRPEAERAGLHAAAAVPLTAEGGVVGVVAFYSRERVERDEETLVTLAALGQHLGQFVLRRRAEARLDERERARAQAAELNDEIVQGLVLARYRLDMGRVEEAASELDHTLAAARRLIDGLLDQTDLLPGRLRRTRAAGPVPGGSA